MLCTMHMHAPASVFSETQQDGRSGEAVPAAILGPAARARIKHVADVAAMASPRPVVVLVTGYTEIVDNGDSAVSAAVTFARAALRQLCTAVAAVCPQSSVRA